MGFPIWHSRLPNSFAVRIIDPFTMKFEVDFLITMRNKESLQ